MSDPARHRRLSADARRDEILATARRLFADKGYHATTTRQLANSAGMSDALLYRHFASKRAVLDGVVDRYLDHLVASTLRALSSVTRAEDRARRGRRSGVRPLSSGRGPGG